MSKEKGITSFTSQSKISLSERHRDMQIHTERDKEMRQRHRDNDTETDRQTERHRNKKMGHRQHIPSFHIWWVLSEESQRLSILALATS